MRHPEGGGASPDDSMRAAPSSTTHRGTSAQDGQRHTLSSAFILRSCRSFAAMRNADALLPMV